MLGGAGYIGICSDKLCTAVYHLNSLFDLFEIIRSRFAHNNVIGVDVVHIDTFVIKRVYKSRLADDVSTAAGLLIFNEFSS